MTKKTEKDLTTLLIEAHAKGVEMAIDASIRTGVPLAVEKNGKIVLIKPKYKYVRVPIKDTTTTKPTSKRKKKLT